jgi:hypothetical protein
MVKFVATDEEHQRVRSLVAYGIRQEAICATIVRPRSALGVLKPISHVTLRRHFRHDLDTGLDTMIAVVADSLYKRAVNQKHPQGAISAMFILKCRAGWTEKHQLSVVGADGKDLKVDVDLRGLNDEELLAFNQLLTKVTITPPANDHTEAA